MTAFFMTCLWLADVSPSIGVNIHFTSAPARDLDLIRDAGFGWIRMDLTWGAVEREKGVYRFEPYDQLLDGLAARGMRAVYILDYSNRLYEESHSVRTAEGRAAFARFAAAAAGRYRGRGVRWEIWNEPNIEQFWKPQPSADDYAALAVETARALRAADPEARIMAPATSTIPLDFLDRVFEKGLLEHVDEVSVHPYRSTPPETVILDYARLRQLIARRAPAGKKPPAIVSGEWGYSSVPAKTRVTEELQAAYLARQLLTNLAEGIALSIWYDWANDGPDRTENEHNFGTVTEDRKPKPAYRAAKTLSRFLAGAAFARRLPTAEGDHLLLFEADRKARLAAWTEREPHRARVWAVGLAGKVAAVGLVGEEESLEAEGELLEVAIDGRPRYVELPVAASELAAAAIEVIPYGPSARVEAGVSGKGKGAARIEVRWNKEVKKSSLMLDGEKRASLKVEGMLPARVAASLLDARSGKTLAEAPARTFDAPGVLGEVLAGDLKGLAVALDGDAKVEGEARLVTGGNASPIAHPARLEYRFGKGWRFARVAVKGKAEIPGKPRALSVWIEGDGSGNALRVRFQDAEGETYQASAGELNWNGWRRLEIPLDGQASSHWGGDQDGQVDYPIRWDTLLLLDSTRKPGQGAIRFGGAVLVYGGE